MMKSIIIENAMFNGHVFIQQFRLFIFDNRRLLMCSTILNPNRLKFGMYRKSLKLFAFPNIIVQNQCTLCN